MLIDNTRGIRRSGIPIIEPECPITWRRLACCLSQLHKRNGDQMKPGWLSVTTSYRNHLYKSSLHPQLPPVYYTVEIGLISCRVPNRSRDDCVGRIILLSLQRTRLCSILRPPTDNRVVSVTIGKSHTVNPVDAWTGYLQERRMPSIQGGQIAGQILEG